MASAETAKLIATLDLQGNFIKNVGNAQKSLGALSSSIAKSRAVAVGLGVGLERAAEKGLSALGDAIGTGIEQAQILQRAQAQTQAVIQSTGAAAGVSADQVRAYAEALEDVTTADDKSIQQGENLLLTFTKIGSDVFPDATKAMVNMAIALNKGDASTADFDTSAKQLGKALQDPVKGITALRKAGVSFDEQQQKQIKTLVKAGRTADAQRLILAELEKEFGKAGEAAGQGFSGDINRFRDSVEDAQVAIAQGLMPAVAEVARELTTVLKDPAVKSGLKQLGVGIGDAIKGLVAFAKTVPWGSIASSLQAAAGFAKDLLNAFLGLPDWVKTAVITGWGLNKLTGGALNDLIGSLASGLVKGVLGINAGVVQVNAATVTGLGAGGPAGGIPGWSPTAGGGGGLSGLIKGIPIIGAAIAGAEFANIAGSAIADKIKEAAPNIGGDIGSGVTKTVVGALTGALGIPNLVSGLQEVAGAIQAVIPLIDAPIQGDMENRRGQIGDALARDTFAKMTDLEKNTRSTDEGVGKLSDDIAAVQKATTTASGKVADDVVRSGNLLYAGQYGAAAGIIGAIQSNRPIIDVNVDISGTTLQQTVSVTDRGGSPDSDRFRGGKPAGGM